MKNLPVPEPAAPAPAKRPLPRNLSAPIPCTLPGYEGITFVFITSRSKAGIEAAQAQGGDSGTCAYLIAEIQGWPFEGDAPEPGNPASFDACEAWGFDLPYWILKEGYPAALKSAISPN